MSRIGSVASEEKSFENVNGRTDAWADGRRSHIQLFSLLKIPNSSLLNKGNSVKKSTQHMPIRGSGR